MSGGRGRVSICRSSFRFLMNRCLIAAVAATLLMVGPSRAVKADACWGLSFRNAAKIARAKTEKHLILFPHDRLRFAGTLVPPAFAPAARGVIAQAR
jgi:hypothetical protein